MMGHLKLPRYSAALSALATLATQRRALWNYEGQPLNKWVGYHDNNSRIAWQVFANVIKVFDLLPARAGIQKSRTSFAFAEKHSSTLIPNEVQQKLVRLVEQFPRMDYEGALAAAQKLYQDRDVARYFVLDVQTDPKQHAPSKFPVTKIESSTKDGELSINNTNGFRLIIRRDPERKYRNAVKGDLAIAFAWVRANLKRIPRMPGQEILEELRGLGFYGDSY